MSNFQFLEPDFTSLALTAKEAEKLTYISPQFALAAARTSLENLVYWLYQYDKKLTQPYDASIYNLLNDAKFKEIIPPYIWDKMDNIRMVGNSAVHGKKFRQLTTEETVKHISHLFLIYVWFERNYGSPSKDRSQPQLFNIQLIPNTNAQPVAVNQELLQKQTEQKEKEFAEKHKELREREQKLFELSASIEEREKLLANIDAELAQKRTEIEQAKLANSKIEDHTDYKEDETRKLKIDLMLEEAGWEIGASAREEVLVTGMPSASGKGFVDYVLYAENGKPLAVVEAKRTSTDPDVGQQQAKLYADCLEQQTGQRPVIFYTNGYKTRIWNDVKGGPPRLVHGFYTQAELQRLIERRRNNPDLASFPINEEIAGRYYQTRAIKAMLAAYQRNERAGLLIMATGTGKTRTAIALVDVLMKANVVQKVLFLADRTSLVNQAHNAFKANLQDASFVNLLEDRNQVGRVYFSTYQTMMGLIDEKNADGTHKFGTGMFDLIIVDEAHRSVYQKFGEIFKYFDSLLAGLTATPRDEVDRDTYGLFGLESGVPTDFYDLDQAIADGYLVPPKAYSVPLKFLREGVKYDELSEEEKQHWDSLNWGDEASPEEVGASRINRELFNTGTVDKMLKHLMENGIKVEGGDRLGKTIIFAVNQRHANFIEERFNANYPQYNGKFARVITHATRYSQSIIDDFSKKDLPEPQIAISVDMLDTGIDVPEVVNLVFFKAVRSKVKFMQMIGRGTRLCEDLFAPDTNKKGFYIFDYCSNFEYFNENPDGAPVSTAEPLGQRLFKARLNILTLLNATSNKDQELITIQDEIRKSLQNEVKSMNNDNFIVKSELEHVEHFKKDEAWDVLDDIAVATLREHISKLPNQLEPETLEAKLFDMLCYNLELAVLEENHQAIQVYVNRIVEIASKLETKENIPVVAQQMALIQEIQTAEYWKAITLPMLELMRKCIRGLVKLIEKSTSKIIYTMLDDEIGEAGEVYIPVVSSGVNIAQYRKRVESFIKANENHITIAKLKRGLALTPIDLRELERFIFEAQEVESKEKFEQYFGTDQPLSLFIRSLVGLDRQAVQEAFSKYLQGTTYNEQQIRFVEMIVEHLTIRGTLAADQLYEPPFNQIHYEGVDGVFKGADVNNIFDVVAAFNESAVA